MTFSIVIPTYRRSAMLALTLPSYLLAGADEVIVVDDASGLSDADHLAALAKEHGLRLLRLPVRVGQAAGKNEGAARAAGDWVVFGEDDVWFPPEYAATLIAHAEDAGAPVASGAVPLVHPYLLASGLEEIEAAICAATVTRHPMDRFLRSHWPVERLPSGDVVTPLLAATAAVHRSVFERVRFDPGYRGNAFREETDFFFSCVEAGFRTIHCPHAICGHMKVHSRATQGGSWDMSRPRYAAQMFRNNWRFLRKHEALLREARTAVGRPSGPLRMQVEFLQSMLLQPRPARA